MDERRARGRESSPSGRPIKSVERACRILAYLTDLTEPAMLKNVATHLGVHRTTALRLLVQLERAGLVERASPGRYHLGLTTIVMAGAVLGRSELLRTAEPYLRRLSDASQQTVNLTVRHGREILNIDRIQAAQVVRSFNWIGHRAPLHRGAAAKALLAHLDDRAISAYVDALSGATDKAALRRELREVRSKGFAVNRGEVDPDVYAVGAPIFDRTGSCCASVSIAGYQEDFTEQRIREYARQVVETAEVVSRRLGYPRRKPVGIG